MRILTIFFLVVALLPSTGALAQWEPCDLNNNGNIDVADLIRIIGYFYGNVPLPDSLPIYDPNLDCDRDGLHLTINDATSLAFRLIYGFSWGRGNQWWLPADSLYIPETEISPGDLVDIPIYLRSEHPLTYVQIGLRYDPDLLEIDEFVVSDSIPGDYPLGGYSTDASMSLIVQVTKYYDEIYYSGHLGNLKVRALVGGPVELETSIEFFSDPRQAFYNGICSCDYLYDAPGIQLFFTHPTTVDGIIRIVDRDRLDKSAPGDSPMALKAYPNPFNTSVEFAFELGAEAEVEVAVFDLLGREVARVHDGRLPAGENTLIWNAGGLPSGVYFCRLADGRERAVRRITLLK